MERLVTWVKEHWLPAALLSVSFTFALVKVAPEFVFNVHIDSIFASGHSDGLSPSQPTPTSISPRQFDDNAELQLYREASACIARSCIFERCLATYTITYPFGPSGAILKGEAEKASTSARCAPQGSRLSNQEKCVQFNGTQHCG
jgi:hypothetical protein